jgi:hypothetical protein
MSDEPKFTDETYVRIYDDQSGHFWQVGPDRDALDLCEISYFEDDLLKPMRSMTVPWPAALLMASAIQTTYNENQP